MQFKEKFTNSKLTDWKKSPDDWIMELEIITSSFDQMGHKIKDEDFMIHVLGNLSEEYESKIESLEKDFDHQYDPLTVERMTNELNVKYKKNCKKNVYDPDEDEKKKESKGTALGTTSYQRFKGRCYTCGNFGHKSTDCPNKKNDSENGTNKKRKRFNGRCTHCGRWGHKRPDRWYCKKEQERQNSNSKNVNVTSETKTDKDVALITDVTCGSETALLCTEICKDVFSGASSHMTNTLQGMYTNVRYHPK